MLLAIAAAVLVYFMPSGVKRERIAKKRRQAPQTYRKQFRQRTKANARARNLGAVKGSSRVAASRAYGSATRNIGWARIDEQNVATTASLKEDALTQEPLPRLPDPLTARLGEIEKVEWAKVIRLAEIKTDAENNLSSETLDEILRRRRAN